MLTELLTHIYDKQTTQKKKIELFFDKVPQAKLDLKDFLDTYAPLFESHSLSAQDVANTYSTLVQQALYCRTHFVRTGEYPISSQDEALETVYTQNDVMLGYMIGLALSQFLWEHHYRLFNFFKQGVNHARNRHNFLEIGCGAGVHLLYILNTVSNDAHVEVVDISQTSIDISKNILELVSPHSLQRVNFTVCDVIDYQTEQKFDFINMGEVLEHVEQPDRILHSLHRILAPTGQLHVTTCANCPTIDHVYHYQNTEEIKDMISTANYAINDELIAPSVDKPPEYLDKHKVDISYAAMLTSQETK